MGGLAKVARGRIEKQEARPRYDKMKKALNIAKNQKHGILDVNVPTQALIGEMYRH